MATAEAIVVAAAAAMAAKFEKFVQDPGVLEGIDYSNRTKLSYPSIEGVGMILAETKHFDSTIRAEDFEMALMIWKGEKQMEGRRAAGQPLVLNGSWGALAQEMKDMIVACSISADEEEVSTMSFTGLPDDVLGRLYYNDVLYDGVHPSFFRDSMLHFRVLDLDFSSVVSLLRALPRSVKAGMLQNGRLAIYLAFSAEYRHAADAGRIWPWAQFCLGVEKMLGRRRIPWHYFADEDDDVLHQELEILVYKALDGVETPVEVRALIEGMQQAPQG